MPTTWIDVADLGAWLSLGDRELVSIVGGGGKTTTLFALGRQLDQTVIMTTTTKMGSERDEGHLVLLDPSDTEIAAHLARDRRVLVWGSRGSHRADGVAPASCDRWFETGVANHVIVEADGSRRRPFKAPYPYEPVVPQATTVLVACIGLSAIGIPIADGCHRPDAVVEIVGGSVNEPLRVEHAAHVLLSEAGSRKGLPDGARFVILAQQARSEHESIVDDLADALGDVEFAAVRAM